MLTPPSGLTADDLVSALNRGWGRSCAALAYRAVGFGSHHWEVVDTTGAAWFLTVDELEQKRYTRDEPLDVAFDRLQGSLGAALALRQHGFTFPVAAVPTLSGAVALRVEAGFGGADQAGNFGAALYPLLDGDSFAFGEFDGPAHREAVLDLLALLHTAPASARAGVPVDGFEVPHRDELAAALASCRGGDGGSACGPFAEPLARLLAEHAAAIERFLERYDTLVAGADRGRLVLTHGEPHPGNTMRTAQGWRLIDWDTALVAPPERDLWGLGEGLHAYVDATGITPDPSLVELYRIRWDLADLAVDVTRFRHPHTGTEDDQAAWEIIRELVLRLAA